MTASVIVYIINLRNGISPEEYQGNIYIEGLTVITIKTTSMNYFIILKIWKKTKNIQYVHAFDTKTAQKKRCRPSVTQLSMFPEIMIHSCLITGYGITWSVTSCSPILLQGYQVSWRWYFFYFQFFLFKANFSLFPWLNCLAKKNHTPLFFKIMRTVRLIQCIGFLGSAHRGPFFGVYDVVNNYVFKKKLMKINVNLRFSCNIYRRMSHDWSCDTIPCKH